MMCKKGQSGSRAGLMIILITVVLLIYLLFIPPADREALLEGGETSNLPSDGNFLIIEELLDQRVGTLDYSSRNELTYSIPTFTVATSIEGTTIQERNQLQVSRSTFSEDSKQMTFNVNPDLTRDIVLSFTVVEASGTLTVELNGEEIYVDTLVRGNSPPIRITPQELQRENTLRFSVDTPGITFWRTNEYTLRNVQITADVQDVSQRANTQSVYIEQDDFDTIEIARLRYVPQCEPEEVTGFEISFNNFNLFRGVPDCGVINAIKFDPAAVFPGANDITTRVQTGSVLVDAMELETRFEGTQNKQYFFSIPRRFFTTDSEGVPILPDAFQVRARFTFPNDEEKRLNTFFNGRLKTINTREPEVEFNITEYVEPGSNVVELEPVEDISIARLEIDLIGEE